MLDWLKNNLNHAVTVPLLLSTANFGLLLFESLMDGVITDNELHQLMQTSSGINMIILCGVLAIIKIKR
jgi:hypothetical protein